MLIDKKPDDSHFLYVTLIFGAMIAYAKYGERFERFISQPRIKIALGLIIFGAVIAAVTEILARIGKARAKRAAKRAILGAAVDSVYCGKTGSGEEVHLKPSQRAMHTQVVGTTNAGKTESVILPWAIQDAKAGRGLLIVDGKSDRAVLDKLYAYCVKFGRADDFLLFSLSHIDESDQFNPLIGGTPEEIAERVFNSFEIEQPYYRSIQFEVFVQTLRVFEEIGLVPTFERLHQAISNPGLLLDRMSLVKSRRLVDWLQGFSNLPSNDRLERTSGLLSAIGQFAFGKHADLFNSERPAIEIQSALENGKIVYFQLPSLLSPFLGKATGKLVLQSLQAAIGNRHRSKGQKNGFFSVFLDDFTEYLYPGFVTILNKSRSAKVGIVFAHQALGDIKSLGDSVANSILTNSNLKVFMRGSDPETAEYFSRVIGTQTTTKSTERAKKAIIGSQATGDKSLREVEEFIIHPNRFKSSLGVGEAFIVIPHGEGSRTEHVKLQMFDEIPPLQATVRPRKIAMPLMAIPANQATNQSKVKTLVKEKYGEITDHGKPTHGE